MSQPRSLGEFISSGKPLKHWWYFLWKLLEFAFMRIFFLLQFDSSFLKLILTLMLRIIYQQCVLDTPGTVFYLWLFKFYIALKKCTYNSHIFLPVPATSPWSFFILKIITNLKILSWSFFILMILIKNIIHYYHYLNKHFL